MKSLTIAAALIACGCGKSASDEKPAPKPAPADAATPQSWYRVAACGLVAAERVDGAPLPIEVKATYRLGVVSTETMTVYPGHWFCAMGAFPSRGPLGDAPVITFDGPRDVERADELRGRVAGAKQGYERLYRFDDEYVRELHALDEKLAQLPDARKAALCKKLGALVPDPEASKKQVMEDADRYVRTGTYEQLTPRQTGVAASLRATRGACKFTPAPAP